MIRDKHGWDNTHKEKEFGVNHRENNAFDIISNVSLYLQPDDALIK